MIITAKDFDLIINNFDNYLAERPEMKKNSFYDLVLGASSTRSTSQGMSSDAPLAAPRTMYTLGCTAKMGLWMTMCWSDGP
jgi:hypothetical protein